LKLLLTGIELHVFNHLEKPTSADDVAQMLDTHPENTRAFLDGLAAIDLVQKRQGCYLNAPIAQTFLVDGNPTYVGQMLSFMAGADALLEQLTHLVKEGPPPSPSTPPVSEERFSAAAVMMANTERAGDAQQAVQLVSQLPEFSSFQRMLDLGGGPGITGMALVDAHPRMQGVIFDLPPVVSVAETFIHQYGMDDRVTVLGGDFNQDPLGDGYDLVFTANALQFAHDLDAVVTKVHDALNPRGVFVSIFGFGQTHDGTKPETLVLGLLAMTLTGQTTRTDHGHIAASMLRAGFRTVHSQPITSAWGSMELDIARKHA
jgi:predicted O-methyltransferase YrrM